MAKPYGHTLSTQGAIFREGLGRQFVVGVMAVGMTSGNTMVLDDIDDDEIITLESSGVYYPLGYHIKDLTLKTYTDGVLWIFLEEEPGQSFKAL